MADRTRRKIIVGIGASVGAVVALSNGVAASGPADLRGQAAFGRRVAAAIASDSSLAAPIRNATPCDARGIAAAFSTDRLIAIDGCLVPAGYCRTCLAIAEAGGA